MHKPILALILATLSLSLFAEDWPQWLGEHRDSEWRETGLIEKFPAAGPTVLWRTPVGPGYSGPAVADGRVYVFDYQTQGAAGANEPQTRPVVKGSERLLCLDEATGKPLWEYAYDCPYEISYPGGPRATPTVFGGKVYGLGAEGDLFCLNAQNGKLIWKKNFKKDYGVKTPLWGFSCNPLVDGKKLICIVGGEGSVAVAFDKDSGAEIWKALSAREPGYSSPEIIDAGGVRQLLIWHPEALASLDPETGKPYWSVPIAPMYGMSIMTPRKVGNNVYVGGIGFKSVMVKLDAERPTEAVLWRGDKSTGIFPKIGTPVVDGDYLYGVGLDGEMQCIKAETGERMWETYAVVSGQKVNSGGAFVVKNGSRYVIFNETGDLIFAHLTPKAYEEISRAHLVDPTEKTFGRDVVWSHPAFAQKKCFARNGKEIICVDLAQK
jgi:outer membrane protein assembly factor BamB